MLGPEKLPRVVAEVGRWVGRARAMARQFREQLEEEVQLEEARKSARRRAAPATPGAGAATRAAAARDLLPCPPDGCHRRRPDRPCGRGERDAPMNGEPEKLAEGTLISHLLELRDRLLRALIAIGIAFVPCVLYSNDIFTFVAQPLLAKLPEGGSLIATGVMSPFTTPFKLSFFIAVFIAMPYVIYQLWSFVAPGLYRNERRFAVPLLLSAILLFYVGIAFAYYFVFPVMFQFFASTTPKGVAMMTDINNYLDFVLTMFFCFGLAFEVPVAVVLLVVMGLVRIEKLKQEPRLRAASASSSSPPSSPRRMPSRSARSRSRCTSSTRAASSWRASSCGASRPRPRPTPRRAEAARAAGRGLDSPRPDPRCAGTGFRVQTAAISCRDLPHRLMNAGRRRRPDPPPRAATHPRPAAGPGDAVPHRDVGALHLLRHARGADPVHGRRRSPRAASGSMTRRRARSTGCTSAAPICSGSPGGWVADRLLGAQRAVFAGGVLITAGNLVLAFASLGNTAALLLGLLVIALGVGLLKPNVSALVAALYPEGGARRDAGFSIFYMGINLGRLPRLAAACRCSRAWFGWHWGFALPALGMALGLVQFR